jgi:hypothetical protein
MFIVATGSPGAARNVICPAVTKLYSITNSTTGGFALTLKTSAGSGISVPNGATMLLKCDGTNVVQAVSAFTDVTYTTTLTGGTGVVNLGSGQLYKDASGNVGVGTTAPAARLESSTTSAGATAEVLRLSNPGAGGNTQAQIKFFTTSTNYGTISGGYGATVPQMTFDLPSATAGNYVWQISSTERMRLDASGNLGVGGTPNASAKLEVFGESRINPATGAANLRFMTAGTERGRFAVDTTSNMLFETAGSEKMRLDASGNLGLGVTPSAWGNGVSLQGNAWALSTTAGTDSGAFTVNARQTAYGTGSQNYVYRTTAPASSYEQTASVHRWLNAPSGTAGNAITFTQAMTLDASGNLLVGRASGGGGRLEVDGNYIRYGNSASYTNDEFLLQRDANGVNLKARQNTNMLFATNDIERMRLDASGNLLINTTSSALSNSNSTIFTPSGQAYWQHANGTASGSVYIGFAYNGGLIGSITQSGTAAVLYNTTSDQRLKTNIQDAAPASALIDAIQVRQFDWKSDGSHQRYGMVAQELHAVAPEAVHAPADPDEMMAVDYSKLVPMLIKEVQDLRARVASLEAV